MRNLGNPGARNRGHANRVPITQEIKPAREIVSALAVGDDALIAFVPAGPRGSATSHLHKSL